MDKRDKPWDAFLLCIKDYNKKRQQLINAMLLILDESISGWRPKTLKLRGLPNYAFGPRKPGPLGAMFKNGAE